MAGARGPGDPGRRDRIAAAALEVALAQGVHAVSHRAVAAAAGVPLGSTTYHFRTLDDLLAAAMGRAAAAFAAELDAWDAALGDDAIMAGDCNAAPWSAAVRHLAAQGGMTVMPSVGPTWLWRRLPDTLRFAGLPIDQVFSKGGVTVRSMRKLAPAGSDHLPILVEFSVPAKKQQDDSKTATASASPKRPLAFAHQG